MLAPLRSTVLKVSRHNARVDEGFNDVEVVNAEETLQEWGKQNRSVAILFNWGSPYCCAQLH